MKISLSPFIIWLVLGFFIITMIGACNSFISLEPNKMSVTENCRVIQHVMGETCVPLYPQRVVILSADTLGNALALNVKPIGVAHEFLEEGEFHPYFPTDKIQEIVTLGEPDRPNLERILKLKPDLILGWGGSSLELYSLLSRIAPTIFYNWQDDTWKNNFNFVAEVLGKKEVAQTAWKHYETRIQELRSALADRYKDKKISCILVSFGGFGINTKDSFPGSILSDAGLQRPESQNVTAEPFGFISVSEEQIEKADGDVLFVIRYVDQEYLKELKRRPLWRNLKAVQQERVYFVTDSAWYGQNMIAANVVIDELFKYLIDLL